MNSSSFPLPVQLSRFLKSNNLSRSLFNLKYLENPNLFPKHYVTDNLNGPHHAFPFVSTLSPGIGISAWAASFLTSQNWNQYGSILEIGCAPGSKSALLSKIFHGNLFGVDINLQRLFRAQKLIPSTNLFVGDATCDISTWKPLSSDTRLPPATFDCVVIDAPCTGDTRLKDLQIHYFPDTITNPKFRSLAFKAKNKYSNGFLSETRISELTQIQYQLLSASLKLLNPGGILYYITCSFSQKQNQEIIDQLLSNNSHLETIPLSTHSKSPLTHQIFLSQEICNNSVHFQSGSSGGFVVKIKKSKS